MTKRWSSVKSGSGETKRAASKKARRDGKRHLTREEQDLYHKALRRSVRIISAGSPK